MLKFGNKYPQLPGIPQPVEVEEKEYVHEEYPKYIVVQGVGRLAANPDEEAALLSLNAPPVAVEPAPAEPAKEGEHA